MATPTFLLFSIFFFLMTFSSSTNPKTFTAELIHRDSPHSPFYNPLNTVTDRLSAAFLRSISRSRRFNNNSPTDLQSDLIEAGGEFYMSISIGTPPTKVFAIADTGSDLTWVQCKPCQHCYKESGPLFDKEKSSTYKNEPCDSRNCLALITKDRGCDKSKNICKYSYPYRDKSFTKGDIATETISIDSTLGTSVPFPRTVFGCGYNNGGIFDPTGSGIVGLGGGKLSLTSQLGSNISKKFSYCLSHKASTMNGTSLIYLGNNSIPSGTSKNYRLISTPLVDKPPRTYYYVTLEAISVGKRKIPYTNHSHTRPALSIDRPTVKPGNIVIDLGSPLTLLNSGFFKTFGAVVEETVTGAKRVSGPLFPYCFLKAGNIEIGLPEITFHFTGADVKLSTLNAFVEVREDVICLSMIPTNGVAIYGNIAQMDFRVGFDLESRTVSFQQSFCATENGVVES